MKSQHKLFKDLVLRFAEESHCVSRHVACIAVKDNRIISTGINGTLEGSINCDEYWEQKLLPLFIQRVKNSEDVPQEQALLKAKELLVKYYRDSEFLKDHHLWSNNHELHAEQNCIGFAARKGISLEGCDFYVTLSPCIHCAKLLATVKPKNVFYIEKYDKGYEESIALLTDAGIRVEQIF